MAQTNETNRMEIHVLRTSPKQVQVVIDLFAPGADTAYITIDGDISETAELKDGAAQTSFTFQDSQREMHVHHATAEFFRGEDLTPCGATEQEFAT